MLRKIFKRKNRRERLLQRLQRLWEYDEFEVSLDLMRLKLRGAF